MADVRTAEWPSAYWRGGGVYDKGGYWECYGPNKVIGMSETKRLTPPEEGGSYRLTIRLHGGQDIAEGALERGGTEYSSSPGEPSVGSKFDRRYVPLPASQGSVITVDLGRSECISNDSRRSFRVNFRTATTARANYKVNIESIGIAYIPPAPPVQLRAPQWPTDWQFREKGDPRLILEGARLTVGPGGSAIWVGTREDVFMPVDRAKPWLVLTADHGGTGAMLWGASADWRDASGRSIGDGTWLGSAQQSGEATRTRLRMRVDPPAGADLVRLSLMLSSAGAMTGLEAVMLAEDPGPIVAPKPPPPPPPPPPVEELRPGWGTTGPGWGTTGPGWGRRGPGWM